MQRWIERLAEADKRSDAVPLQHIHQVSVNRLEAFQNARGYFGGVRQGPIESIHYVEQRHDQVALPTIRGLRSIAIYTAAIIVKIGESTEVHVMLPP